MDENKIREIVRKELGIILGTDKYIITRDMKISDGRNFQLAKGTGTMIGTESVQKIGFLGKSPVAQQAAISTPSGGTTIDSYARARIDDIRAVLIAFGFTAP